MMNRFPCVVAHSLLQVTYRSATFAGTRNSFPQLVQALMTMAYLMPFIDGGVRSFTETTSFRLKGKWCYVSLWRVNMEITRSCECG